MGTRFLASIWVAVAPTALAGMYDQPWARVQSGDRSQVRKEERLAISKVDGKSARNTRQSDPLSPGKHLIEVRFETAAGPTNESTRELEIDLDACTTYRIVAAYEGVGNPNWKPKVYSEPIGECVAKFKIGKGKPT